MSSFLKSFLLIAVLALVVSCGRKPDRQKQNIPVFDSKSAYAFAKDITSIGSRKSGSPGAEKNIQYMLERVREIGVKPITDTWTETTPAGKISFTNIVVELKGEKDGYVIIGAHHDTKLLESTPDFQGANDGASGCALLLAMIKTIADSGFIPPHSLKFVFFDGEECFFRYSLGDGLFGSRRMARKMNEDGTAKLCKAVIIADMIGDRYLSITVPQDSDKKLAEILFESANKLGLQKNLKWHSSSMLDDHSPFQEIGLPSIDIIDFEYGENNRYWHTREDSIDKLSEESLSNTGQLILEMICD